MSIDYHVHTTFSDGTLTPDELIEACRKSGITDIGITDHYGTHKYSDNFQVKDIKEYIKKLNELKEKNADIKIHIGLEVDFSNMYGNEISLYDIDNMNRVDYLLFEHVNTEYVEGNRVNGRRLEELIAIRDEFECPVGLAHNNFQQNFSESIKDSIYAMKENNIFLELCEAEDKGKKVVDNLLFQQMMEIKKNFNSVFDLKDKMEKLKQQKADGNSVHMKHAIDGKYYFELFEESTWECIKQSKLKLSLSSDSHKGLEIGKSKKVLPYIKKYKLEEQLIFR